MMGYCWNSYTGGFILGMASRILRDARKQKEFVGVDPDEFSLVRAQISSIHSREKERDQRIADLAKKLAVVESRLERRIDDVKAGVDQLIKDLPEPPKNDLLDDNRDAVCVVCGKPMLNNGIFYRGEKNEYTCEECHEAQEDVGAYDEIEGEFHWIKPGEVVVKRKDLEEIIAGVGNQRFWMIAQEVKTQQDAFRKRLFGE